VTGDSNRDGKILVRTEKNQLQQSTGSNRSNNSSVSER